MDGTQAEPVTLEAFIETMRAGNEMRGQPCPLRPVSRMLFCDRPRLPGRRWEPGGPELPRTGR